MEKPKRRADRGAVVTVTGHTRPPPPPARPRTPSRGSVACRIWWFSSPSSWRRRARPRRPAPSSRRGTHKSCAPSACEVSGREANRVAPRPAGVRQARESRASRELRDAFDRLDVNGTPPEPRVAPAVTNPRAPPPPPPPEPWAFLVFLAVPLFPTARVRFPVSGWSVPGVCSFSSFSGTSRHSRDPLPLPSPPPPPPPPPFFQDSAFSIAPRSPPRASRPVYPVVTISSRRWRRRLAPARARGRNRRRLRDVRANDSSTRRVHPRRVDRRLSRRRRRSNRRRLRAATHRGRRPHRRARRRRRQRHSRRRARDGGAPRRM